MLKFKFKSLLNYFYNSSTWIPSALIGGSFVIIIYYGGKFIDNEYMERKKRIFKQNVLIEVEKEREKRKLLREQGLMPQPAPYQPDSSSNSSFLKSQKYPFNYRWIEDTRNIYEEKQDISDIDFTKLRILRKKYKAEQKKKLQHSR